MHTEPEARDADGAGQRPAPDRVAEHAEPDAAGATEASPVYRAALLAEGLTSAAQAEAEEAELAAAEQPLSHDDHLREIKAERDQARDELAEAQEQVKRARAEVINQARRFEQLADEQRRIALRGFLGRLLQVMDDLDRGLDAAASARDIDALTEGMALTRKRFHEALDSAGVKEIDPLGEVFDPQLHEAVLMAAHAEATPNTVLEVTQKGYTIEGKLLRAARVVVAGAASPNS